MRARFLLILPALVACSRAGDLHLPPAPAERLPLRLQVVSGDGQRGRVLEELAQDFVVKALRGEAPQEGVRVTFAVVAGGGSLSAASAATDAQGLAAVRLRLGPKLVTNRATASAESALAEFSAEADAGPVALLFIAGGDGESRAVDDPAPFLLSVRAFDAQQNPVPGAAVTFAKVLGDAAVEALGNVTDAAGVAQARVARLGKAGQIVVAAGAEGVPAVRFTLQATAAAPFRLAAVSGEGQTGAAGEELLLPVEVAVFDRFDNPLPGVELTAQNAGLEGALALSPPSLRTRQDGTAAFTGVFGTRAGGQTGVVLAPEGSGVEALTLHGTALAGEPAAIDDGAGAGALALGLRATGTRPLVVRDAFGNPVPGRHLAATTEGWLLLGTPPATDEQGRTHVEATAQSTAGRYRVSVALGVVQHSFAVEVAPGPAARLVPIEGDGQVAVVQQSFGGNLKAILLDADGNAVGGPTVAATAAGAQVVLSPTSMATAADGIAVFQARAGDDAGLATVTLSTDGLQLPLRLRVAPDRATRVDAWDDSATRRGTVGGPADAPVVVRVVDRLGNPVEDVPISFQTLDGGTLSPVVETGTDGQARSFWLLGPAAGTQEAVASAPGLLPVTFLAEALPGGVAWLEKSAGDLQYRHVCERARFTVVARDERDNPVPGVVVTFPHLEQAEGCTDRNDPTPVVTDAQGRATGEVVLGRAAGAQAVVAEGPVVEGAPLVAAFQVNVHAGPPFTFEPVVEAQAQATVGRPLVEAGWPWRVFDRYGNLAALQSVRLRVVQGGGVVVDAAPVANAAGIVRVHWSLGTRTGLNVLEISSDAPEVVPVLAWARGRPGPKAQVQRVVPDQSLDASRLPAPPVYRALDSHGNLVLDDDSTLGFLGTTRTFQGGYILGPLPVPSPGTQRTFAAADTTPGGALADLPVFSVDFLDTPGPLVPAGLPRDARNRTLQASGCRTGDVLLVGGTARGACAGGVLTATLDESDVASAGTLEVSLQRLDAPLWTRRLAVGTRAPVAPGFDDRQWACGTDVEGDAPLVADYDGAGGLDVVGHPAAAAGFDTGDPVVHCSPAAVWGTASDSSYVADLDGDGREDWVSVRRYPPNNSAGRCFRLPWDRSPWSMWPALSLAFPAGAPPLAATTYNWQNAGYWFLTTRHPVTQAVYFDFFVYPEPPVLTAAGDFDNDGTGDVALWNAKNLHLLRGASSGYVSRTDTDLTDSAFAPVAMIGARLAAGAGAQVVMVDAAGRLWRLAANQNRQFVTQTGTTLRLSTIGAVPRLVAADVDGDGDEEIVAALAGEGATFVVLGLVAGALAETARLEAPLLRWAGKPGAVSVGDVDGDGRPDLVTSTVGRALRVPVVAPGDGPGRFALPRSTAATLIAHGRFDADDLDDVLARTPEGLVRVLASDGLGGLAAGNGYSIQGNVLATVDATGDGVLDLLLSGDGGARFVRLIPYASGVPAGEYAVEGGLPALFRSVSAVSASVFDLDADGRSDLAVLADAGLGASDLVRVAAVLRRRADGRFETVRWQETGPLATSFADLDGDGAPDLVGSLPLLQRGASPDTDVLPLVAFARRDAQGVPVWGDWTYPGGAPGRLLVLDVDADRDLDLATVSTWMTPAGGRLATGLHVSTVINDGGRALREGTRTFFELPTACDLQAALPPMLAGDANADGVPDLGYASWLVLMANGWDAGAPQLMPWGAACATPLAARLDGDAAPDLLVVDDRGRVSTLRGRP